jgi:hypothetical protein
METAWLYNFEVCDHDGVEHYVDICLERTEYCISINVYDPRTGEDMDLLFESNEMDGWVDYAEDKGLFMEEAR